jgi:hypothetical protein
MMKWIVLNIDDEIDDVDATDDDNVARGHVDSNEIDDLDQFLAQLEQTAASTQQTLDSIQNASTAITRRQLLLLQQLPPC